MFEVLAGLRAPTTLTWLLVSLVAGGGLSLVYYLWLRKTDRELRPLRDEVVVKPLEDLEVPRGGVIIPDSAREARSADRVPDSVAGGDDDEVIMPSEHFDVRRAPRRSQPSPAAPSRRASLLWPVIVTGVAVALAVVVGLFAMRSGPESSGAGDWLGRVFGSSQIVAFGTWAFYFGLMLLGMCGQYMWGLKKMSQFSWHEFLRPLWVSIIVFAPFWNTLSDSGISYAAAAGAYQNGFFWKIVLEKEQKRLRGPARVPAARAAKSP